MAPVLRILIGLIFVVSGAEKIIWPYQNFLYVIQGYHVLPPAMEVLVAHVFPWIEFLLGMGMVLGLWLPLALRGVLLMLMTFILVVAQALIRQLPLDECGCFGDLISFPLPVVIIMDICLLVITGLLLSNLKKTQTFSLDKHFKK